MIRSTSDFCATDQLRIPLRSVGVRHRGKTKGIALERRTRAQRTREAGIRDRGRFDEQIKV